MTGQEAVELENKQSFAFAAAGSRLSSTQRIPGDLLPSGKGEPRVDSRSLLPPGSGVPGEALFSSSLLHVGCATGDCQPRIHRKGEWGASQ